MKISGEIPNDMDPGMAVRVIDELIEMLQIEKASRQQENDKKGLNMNDIIE